MKRGKKILAVIIAVVICAAAAVGIGVAVKKTTGSRTVMVVSASELNNGGGWGWGSLTVDFYALKQAEADQILDLIDSTTRVNSNGDDELIQIITQDTAPYFMGQKSLDDVVKQLQSKMNIYINEQR